MKKSVLPFVMCLALLSGCGKSKKEKELERSMKKAGIENAKADIKDDGLTLTGKTDQGDFKISTGSAASIPENFPEDVYIYKNAKVTAGMKVPNGFNVMLSTSDTASKIQSTYKKEMTSLGWQEAVSMNMGGMITCQFKKNGMLTAVTIMKADDNQTNITLTVTSE